MTLLLSRCSSPPPLLSLYAAHAPLPSFGPACYAALLAALARVLRELPGPQGRAAGRSLAADGR